MNDWTPSLVEARLAEAAFVLKRMPEPRLQGYFNAWPEYFHSFADKVGQEQAHAGVAVTAGHQPDGGDPDMDRVPRADRWQDYLDESPRPALENHLLDGRFAAFGGPSALGLRALCDRAHAE